MQTHLEGERVPRDWYVIEIEAPGPQKLAAIRERARSLATDLDPPASFREALSIYRQLRSGGFVFIRCRFDNQ